MLQEWKETAKYVVCWLIFSFLIGCSTINPKSEYAKIDAVELNNTFVSFGDGTGTIYKGTLGKPGDMIKVVRK